MGPKKEAAKKEAAKEAAKEERLTKFLNSYKVNVKDLTDEECKKIDAEQRGSLKRFHASVKNGRYSPSFDEVGMKGRVKAYIETRFLKGLKQQVDAMATMTQDQKRQISDDDQQSYLKTDLRCFDADQFLFYWSPRVTQCGKIVATLKITNRVDLADKRAGRDWLDKLVKIIFMQHNCDVPTPYGNHDPILYSHRSFDFKFEKLKPEHLKPYHGKSEYYYFLEMHDKTFNAQEIDEIKAEIREKIQQQMEGIQKLAATKIQKIARGRKVRKNLPEREKFTQSNTPILSLQSICKERINRLLSFKYEAPVEEEDALLKDPNKFQELYESRIQVLESVPSVLKKSVLKKTDEKILASIKQNEIKKWFEYAMAVGKEPVVDLLENKYGDKLLNGESIKFAMLSGGIDLFEKLLTKVRESQSQDLSEQEWVDVLDYAAASGSIKNFDKIYREANVTPTKRGLEMACVNSQYRMVQHLVREYGLNPNNKDLFILAKRQSDDRMVNLLVRLAIERDREPYAARVIQNFWKNHKGIESCVTRLKLDLPDNQEYLTSKERKRKAAKDIQKIMRGKLARVRIGARKEKNSEGSEKSQTETAPERSIMPLNFFSGNQRGPRPAAAANGPRI